VHLKWVESEKRLGFIVNPALATVNEKISASSRCTKSSVETDWHNFDVCAQRIDADDPFHKNWRAAAERFMLKFA
jgi:hypothetical protein